MSEHRNARTLEVLKAAGIEPNNVIEDSIDETGYDHVLRDDKGDKIITAWPDDDDGQFTIAVSRREWPEGFYPKLKAAREADIARRGAE